MLDYTNRQLTEEDWNNIPAGTLFIDFSGSNLTNDDLKRPQLDGVLYIKFLNTPADAAL